jgi:hypothetical protein
LLSSSAGTKLNAPRFLAPARVGIVDDERTL